MYGGQSIQVHNHNKPGNKICCMHNSILMGCWIYAGRNYLNIHGHPIKHDIIIGRPPLIGDVREMR